MLCSNCLKNEGLRIEAGNLGKKDGKVCLHCNSYDGFKLDKSAIQNLIIRFFHFGSIENNYHLPIYVLSYENFDDIIPFRTDIFADLKLLKEESGYNVAYNAPNLRDLGYTDFSAEIEIIEPKATDRINLLIDELFSKFISKTLDKGEKLYRIRKNLSNPKDNAEFDTPPLTKTQEGRLNNSSTPILYCSNDISTCVHEIKSTVYDNLFLGSYILSKQVKVLSLLDYKTDLSNDEMNNHISYIAFLFRTDLNYKICQLLATRAKEQGFDGIEYYSFFSKVMNDRKSNLALFGYPLRDNVLTLESVNKIRIEKIDYKLNFGPVE